jgi:hypothetical protein
MSKRYPGGVLSATPPTTSTSSATGIWTEQSVFQAVGAGTWPGVPGAPTSVTATDTTAGGAISVAFTAPANNGGSAITSYTVTSSPGSITASGASSPITVTGLTNGTAYTFTVRATNATGTGPASAASNSATPSVITYIEEVFSSFVYTGTGANQVITNNINLSANGGLVWAKNRGTANGHYLIDTVRGGTKILQSNTNGADITTGSAYLTAQTTGYQTGPEDSGWNGSGQSMVSWTFREQSKFFDIVTYTGNGASNRSISHALGSTPGFFVVKPTSTTGSWIAYHRSAGSNGAFPNYLVLNSTDAAYSGIAAVWSAAPTSSVINIGSDGVVNASGETYIAYLWAHNAGGFGATGSDNAISCGSFTADNAGGGAYSGGATVNLGYEPQFVLIKEADSTLSDPNWIMVDTFRGYRAQETSGSDVGQQRLRANTDGTESNAGGCSWPTATGFSALQLTGGATYIYVAVRKSPMKVPTVGTTVYNTVGGSGANPAYIAGFPVDLALRRYPAAEQGNKFYSRLTGTTYLDSTSTAAQVSDASGKFDYQNAWFSNPDGAGYYSWMWRRAPGFMDVVCYTGTGSGGRVLNHNLGVAPQLMIFKSRTSTGDNNWSVQSSFASGTVYNLNNTGNYGGTLATSLTATTITLSDNTTNNAATYVAYLFATCTGVSKVGSFTGNGSTQTINCDFTGGARFVLIKRTTGAGSWYVYDTARGMTTLTDPYLLLNSSAAEVATAGSVTTVATGFALNSAVLAAINESTVVYIFLAIA